MTYSGKGPGLPGRCIRCGDCIRSGEVKIIGQDVSTRTGMTCPRCDPAADQTLRLSSSQTRAAEGETQGLAAGSQSQGPAASGATQGVVPPWSESGRPAAIPKRKGGPNSRLYDPASMTVQTLQPMTTNSAESDLARNLPVPNGREWMQRREEIVRWERQMRELFLKQKAPCSNPHCALKKRCAFAETCQFHCVHRCSSCHAFYRQHNFWPDD